jgi:hypothetical protein
MELANLLYMNAQAVFLNEQGVYETVLPRIERFMVKEGEDPNEIYKSYRDFVKEKRRWFGDHHGLPSWTVGSLGPPVGSPMEEFHKHLNISRMRFCKTLCVHPAKELAIECGKTRGLGLQIQTAFQDAQMPQSVIDELEYRVAEYHGALV